ncbi:MAG TPA: alpha-glucuronidase family glycosyl hydrolase, partial [Bacteroidales bacterium]|nr:alpha-glucuronidase family glycosyl hydrolase [Bacteroidales bacterium]
MKSSYNPIILALIALFSAATPAAPESGYRLWLRYDRISDPVTLTLYRKNITGFVIPGESPLIKSARQELSTGLSGLLGQNIPELRSPARSPFLIAGTPASSKIIRSLIPPEDLLKTGDEGFIIRSAIYRKNKIIVIAANTEK